MSQLKKELKRFERRRNRSKKAKRGSSNQYRLCVSRSSKNIEAQIIDDNKGITKVSASSLNKSIQSKIANAGSKIEKSIIVGQSLAEKAKKAKISRVVFDRNGYPYHGRVKALADAAREGGLEF
ncbi:MAG: 50S ribosomal protein L18 [Candidatus Neomarinimicrobiota bacterium]